MHPLYHQPGYQPPSYVSVAEMQQRLSKTRLYAFLVGLALVLIAFLAGFFIEHAIWINWFQSNCLAYPFLLLNPNNHVACTLPTP